MLFNGSESNLLISDLVGKLRNKQTEAADFRNSLRRLGNFLAYESAKYLDSELVQVETPLGKVNYNRIQDNITVIIILRAALSMSEGVIEVFSNAKLGVISASRGKKLQKDGKDFRIDCTYSNIPYLEDTNVMIVDPMLASGSTLLYVIQQIKEQKPRKIIVLCAIASKYGINRIQTKYPEIHILVGAVDEELNDKGYIVPGLGDAGDRAFNTL